MKEVVERPRTHCRGGWVGHRAGLVWMGGEKLALTEV